MEQYIEDLKRDIKKRRPKEETWVDAITLAVLFMMCVGVALVVTSVI